MSTSSTQGKSDTELSTVEVVVSVPTILRDCTGGRSEVSISGTTLADALQSLRETYPVLRVHLYDESGHLRPHVLIFYNSESIHWLDSLDMPLRSGDRIEILQAVSGG